MVTMALHAKHLFRTFMKYVAILSTFPVGLVIWTSAISFSVPCHRQGYGCLEGYVRVWLGSMLMLVGPLYLLWLVGRTLIAAWRAWNTKL